MVRETRDLSAIQSDQTLHLTPGIVILFLSLFMQTVQDE